MKAIINSLKRSHWFKAPIAFLTCLLFLVFPYCQKDELDQGSMTDMDGLSSSALSKTGNISYGKVKDVEGNVYKTVKIGKQWWMAENLAYLPTVSPSMEGANPGSPTDPYYYVYGYEGNNVDAAKATDNYKTFGVLYNWPAAMTACPAGWHLPSDAEWTALSDYLINNGYGYEGSGEDIAKSLAAQTYWDYSGTPGHPGNDPTSNNSSGLSLLPGGSRGGNYDNQVPEFNCKGISGFYWSSTNGEGSTTDAWGRNLESWVSTFTRWSFGCVSGNSVRCVKN